MIFYILTSLLIAGSLFVILSYTSGFEWTLHTTVMHKRYKFRWKLLQKIADHAFERHALVHHSVFGHGGAYHSADKKKHATIPMSWWHGPALVILASAPWWAGIGIASIWLPCYWLIGVSITGIISLYFCAYEYFHWCMHDPKGRWFESTRWFKRIDAHHHGHHEKMHKNFNVVLPIADILMGTYYRPAPK
jgi:hypothetical protein